MARHSVELLGETDSRRMFRARAIRRGTLRHGRFRARLAGLLVGVALMLLPRPVGA